MTIHLPHRMQVKMKLQTTAQGPNRSPMNTMFVGTLFKYEDLRFTCDPQTNQHSIQLIPCTEDVMRRSPYITASGAAFNVDKTEGVFDCNVPQYTTFYKDRRHLSTLPIRVHFDDIRYKNKKPLPSNNNYVAVEGLLKDVDFDLNNGHASLFHISSENINFLGKAVPPNTPKSQGTLHTRTNLNSLLTVLQHPLLHHGHPDSATTLIQRLHLPPHKLVCRFLQI
jgi:hypothetical protein